MLFNNSNFNQTFCKTSIISNNIVYGDAFGILDGQINHNYSMMKMKINLKNAFKSTYYGIKNILITTGLCHFSCKTCLS